MNAIRTLMINEVIELWEVQAGMDADPTNAKRRETLRECADTLRMLAESELLSAASDALPKAMWELLTSAKAIADRKGVGTAWERFSESCAKLGITGVTARTYRVLPSDEQPADPLASCLDVLLRMIPEFTDETGVETCTDIEHNSAIEAAAIALYGEDRSTWPPGVQKAAEGEYE